MTQSLDINGKQYQPSTVLAKETNYTSDYISKLARDEKILGTREGRQWFVEPESLRTYIQQLEIEKRIGQEALSRQRKLEQRLSKHERSPVPMVISPQSKSLLVAGQSVCVVACGFLVGLLFWTIDQSDLKTVDILDGGEVVVAQVVSGIELAQLGEATTEITKKIVKTNSGVVAGQDPAYKPPAHSHQLASVTTGTYTDFSRLIEPAERSSSTATAFSDGTSVKPDLPFADEVIVREEKGSVQVRPIFYDSMGDWYELSVTKVPPANE